MSVPTGEPGEVPRLTREVWEVYAREKYDEPLHHVGTVAVEDPELACMFARSIYDERPWIEMIVVPRREIRTVIGA